jgi:hypothetical protein
VGYYPIFCRFCRLESSICIDSPWERDWEGDNLCTRQSIHGTLAPFALLSGVSLPTSPPTFADTAGRIMARGPRPPTLQHKSRPALPARSRLRSRIDRPGRGPQERAQSLGGIPMLASAARASDSMGWRSRSGLPPKNSLIAAKSLSNGIMLTLPKPLPFSYRALNDDRATAESTMPRNRESCEYPLNFTLLPFIPHSPDGTVFCGAMGLIMV